MLQSILLVLWYSYNVKATLVNGGWSEWGTWSNECSEPCGEGTHTRWRYCDTPSPSFDGSDCIGVRTDKKPCYTKPCSGLALAAPGESCNVFCYNRGLPRGMLCSPILDVCNDIESIITNCAGTTRPEWINPYEPVLNTLDSTCNGYKNMPSQVSCHERPPSTQQRVCRCFHQEDDLFREWTAWGECTKTCDRGLEFRTRNCNNASNCHGIFAQDRYCNEMKCPVHGNPDQWTTWSSCTVTCGGGMQNRQRNCTDPIPQYDGKQCFNELLETKSCNIQPCEINGTFSEWSSWSTCPVCGDQNNERYMVRYRTCHKPMYGGTPCVGDLIEEILCTNPSAINEQCPTTSVYFNGILPEVVWKNQYFYTYSNDYGALEQTIRNEFYMMFDDFHSSLVHGVYGVRLASLTKVSSGVRVLVEIIFESLNHHQYLYLQECLEMFSTARKLVIQHPFRLNINESYVGNAGLWGSVPLDAPTIINSTTTINSTAVKLDWLKINQSNFEYDNQFYGRYTIFYRIDSRETVYSQRAVSQSEESVVVDNLSPATMYTFYVAASNAWGVGILSSNVKLKTEPELPVLPSTTPSIEMFEVLTGEVYLFWDAVPISCMNGDPKYYNIYVTNIRTNDVMLRKIPYFSLRSTILQLIPSSLYSISICPENERGEGKHCIWKLWQTLPSVPLWNDFDIAIMPRTDTNRIALSWTPIPLAEKRSDLESYEIEYTLVQHNSYIIENPISQYITVHPSVTQHEFQGLSFGGQYMFRMKAITTSGSSPWSSYTYSTTCMCPLKLTTNYVIREPYIFKTPDGQLVGVIKDAMEYVVKKTCGICVIGGTDYYTKLEWDYQGSGECQTKPTLDDVRTSIHWSVHVSFPFFELPETLDINDGKFLPIIEHPGTTLITMGPDESLAVEKQMHQVLTVIPFAIILALFIIISGILAWIFERKSDQFDERFTRGIFQAMYMNYVTLTTVGYGDKFAVTKLGRIFMLFWIVTSLILLSIFIGSISSVITTSSLLSSNFHVKSGTIGALTGSEDFKKGLHLGAHVNIDEDHHHTTYTTYKQLSNDLESNQVQGLLVDAYWVGKNTKLFSKPGMIVREIHKHKKWYGVMLNGPIASARDALHDTVTDNELQISLMFDRYKTDVKVQTEFHVPSLADEHAPQMQSALLFSVIILVITAMIGAVVWYCGFRRWEKNHLSKATRQRFKVNRDCYREFRHLIESWNASIHQKMQKLEEKHFDERVEIWKNMKTGVVHDVRPSNYNISTVKLNRSFLVN